MATLPELETALDMTALHRANKKPCTRRADMAIAKPARVRIRLPGSYRDYGVTVTAREGVVLLDHLPRVLGDDRNVPARSPQNGVSETEPIGGCTGNAVARFSVATADGGATSTETT